MLKTAVHYCMARKAGGGGEGGDVHPACSFKETLAPIISVNIPIILPLIIPGLPFTDKAPAL